MVCSASVPNQVSADSGHASTVAVLSLVGDGLSIVSPRSTTGTLRERLDRRFIPIKDSLIDRTVVRVIAEELRARSDIAPTFLDSHDATLFGLQSKALEQEKTSQDLVKSLLERVPELAKFDYIVLVAKYRHMAQMDAPVGHFGVGSLDGLGFYIDRLSIMENSDTGLVDTGFLATFAYFKVVLDSVQTGRVIAEQPVAASSVRAAIDSRSLNPWDSLSSTEKTQSLITLVTRECASATKVILKSIPRSP